MKKFSQFVEARAKKAVAGGKVQKLITGFGMLYKGKKYDEIDFELDSIDNSSQIVTLKILHPAEHIGDKVKLPFKTLRVGRFMATDTSKINEVVSPAQEEKDSRLAKAGVSGFNKPKRTPDHPTKSHIVVAKDGDQVKTIRFGQQGAETAGDPKKGESERMKKKRKSFKARHAKNISKGKMSAAWWANEVKW